MGKGAGTECGLRRPMEVGATAAPERKEMEAWTAALGAPAAECLEWASRFSIPEALEWRQVQLGFDVLRRPMPAKDAARWRDSGRRPEEVQPWLDKVGHLNKWGQTRLECARLWAVAYAEYDLGVEDVQTYSFMAELGWSDNGSTRRRHTRVIHPKKLRAFMDKSGLSAQLAGDCIRAKVGIRLARKHRGGARRPEPAGASRNR
jgi:hypothetical protein